MKTGDLRSHIRVALPAKRLSDVCSRLASDFDGERANAASIASQMLHEAGVSWAEFVSLVFEEPPVAEPPEQTFDRNTWEGAVEWLLSEHWSELSEWESEFLESIRDRYDLTEKQRVCLAKIFRKFTRPKR